MNRHFDRNKFLLGTYCLEPYARTEAHIADIKKAGIDFICSVPADKELLDLCEKYDMGLFAKYLPFWWGGKGEKAGSLHEEITTDIYEKLAEKFTDHPALWALDLGDEPSALDLPHYGKLFKAAEKLFPNQLPYLNLYPSYGAIWENSPEEVAHQLGVTDYADHIQAFIDNVPADYICYDYYMYTTNPSAAYENLRVVAEKCRESKRDMWIILQVNSHDPKKWINLPQLRHQAFTALAFGVRSINWACWTAGWFHNEVLDDKGGKTEQYDKLCAINADIRKLTEDYMAYRNTSTHFVGFEDSGLLKEVKAEKENDITLGIFSHIKSKGNSIIGHMEGDMGQALFIADSTDPYGENPTEYEVTFCCEKELDFTAIDALITREGDTYRLKIKSNSAVFVREISSL